MFRMRMCAVLIVLGLFMPALLDCLMQGAAGAETMACCAGMTCPTEGRTESCFTATPSPGDLSSLPELRTSLVAPLTGAIELLPVYTSLPTSSARADLSDVPQHAPPDLYTVHLSLLI
jgi:hypothetical protein